ncbi:MAG: ABC transporter ATP-binding protein/permease [Planctomycetes bacterium]|nr:ABC transporter ATP-binding protein/permease [Planctomycetota bacterium]
MGKMTASRGTFFEEDEILGKAYDARLMKRLLQYMSKFKLLVVFVITITISLSAVQVIWPALLGQFIDGPFSSLIKNPDKPEIINEFYIFIVFFAVYISFIFILNWGNTFFANLLGQKIIHNIRVELFNHIENLSLRFFHKNPVGRLVTRVTSDIQTLNELFTSGIIELLADIAKIFAIVVVMLLIDWELALVVLSVTPFLLLFSWVIRNRIRSAFRAMRKKIAVINSFISESFSGARIIKVFCQEKKANEKLQELNKDYIQSAFKMIKNFAFFAPTIHVFSTLAVAGLIYVGGMRIVTAIGMESAGAYKIGEFTQFYFWTRLLFEPLRALAEKYNILQSAMSSSERIFKILDTEIEVKSGKYYPEKIEGVIEFKNVWFSYDEDTDSMDDIEINWVLKDFSMKVGLGETIALVGPTGGGKTTIINLLMRFYDIQKGQIFVDGRDIREYQIQPMRRNFALVLQEVLFFAGTIERNIRLGEKNIDDEKVRWAADKVFALPFIEKLSKSFRTEIHEGGIGLSTGQRQLVAFARALAFDPSVLILDEATANVDTESEEIIQKAMREVMKGRTSIVIAHRLSTIKAANKIYVIHKGEMRETGNHEELIAKDGIYAKLFELQSLENNKTAF